MTATDYPPPATVVLPPCPAWCVRGAGHADRLDGNFDGTVTRDHESKEISVEFAANEDIPARRASITIDMTENVELDGTVSSISGPHILLLMPESDAITGPDAIALAQALTAAATEWYRVMEQPHRITGHNHP